MQDCKIKMKDGAIYCGPLHTWRPEEGWFDIFNNDAPIIWLKDVELAIEQAQRIGVKDGKAIIADVDLLAKAKEDGWVE